jgi:hypothetical protein
LVAVAELAKKQAEVVASQALEVAKLNRAAATEDAARVVALAQAEKEKIALAGAMTETQRVTLEIQRDRDIGVAKELANVKVPTTVITGGGADGKGSNLSEAMFNLTLLRSTGVIPASRPAAPAAK